MMNIVNKLDDYSGFKLIKEHKDSGVKMYMIKEEGQKYVTVKFTVDKIKIPIFNLLCMIYETDLYYLWFPFCKKSFDVISLELI